MKDFSNNNNNNNNNDDDSDDDSIAHSINTNNDILINVNDIETKLSQNKKYNMKNIVQYFKTNTANKKKNKQNVASLSKLDSNMFINKSFKKKDFDNMSGKFTNNSFDLHNKQNNSDNNDDDDDVDNADLITICQVSDTDTNSQNSTNKVALYKKMTFKNMLTKINEQFEQDAVQRYSSAMDILASYLKGQKIIYMESRSYSVYYLNLLMFPSILLAVLASVGQEQFSLFTEYSSTILSNY